MNAERINGTSFEDIVTQAKDHYEKAKIEFINNGGLCMQCGKNPGDSMSEQDPFCCISCNAETKELIDELTKLGGFQILKL